MAYAESRYAFASDYVWDALYIQWGPLALTGKDFFNESLKPPREQDSRLGHLECGPRLARLLQIPIILPEPELLHSPTHTKKTNGPKRKMPNR